MARGFSLRYEFPNEWHGLLTRPRETILQSATFPLTKERFPILAQRGDISIASVDLYPVVSGTITALPTLSFSRAGGTQSDIPLAQTGGVLTGHVSGIDGGPGEWTVGLEFPDESVPRDVFRDIVVICNYTVTVPP